ncbi:MAG: hypothetical protein QOJ84_4870 [Bradyrhizobium sp.]|jgi:hypothetical protein|nr:hypothetical protein [Bradyrhizobium sp.]
MTMAEMTEPAATAAAPPPTRQRHLGLRVLLIIVAIFEALDALSSVSILFGDMSQVPGPGIGGFLIKTHIATHLPLALAALVFAAIGRVRYTIIALGAVVAMTWLNYMPSVVLHGLGFDSGFSALHTTAQIIAFPLMAACAIALAARDRRLGLATALVGIPTLVNVFGVIAFAIGVSLYGF